ncbi:MAG: hypothetical protein RLZZ224_1782 [Verrucomicrobiota bacterium]
MQKPIVARSVKPQSKTQMRGFTLIVTISLLVLLTIIAIGLLSLSSTSIRSSSGINAQAMARANARMALMLAIGSLQQHTGPDQRITLSSQGLTNPNPANPHWTGASAVNASALQTNAKQASIQWLVSGFQPNPETPLTYSNSAANGNALRLGTFRSLQNPASDLLAPLVQVQHAKYPGRYAWWISDEGAKARVDLEAKDDFRHEKERLARSQSAMEPDFKFMGTDWSNLAARQTFDKNTLITLPTISLATADRSLGKEWFHDLNTGACGLPVNVVDGGMKADLSLIFDRAQLSRPFGERYLGATASTTSWQGTNIYDFGVRDANRFYLSRNLSNQGSTGVGPNWGNLWNYAMLWQHVANHQMNLLSAYPMLDTDLRFKNWMPYSNHNQGAFRRDIQHTNSSVTPVLSLFQMGFRLNSELAPPTNPPTNPPLYRAQIGIQPVIGLWNPYNVAIRTAPYRIDWGLYPQFRFNYARPLGNGNYTDSRLTELWLREEWTMGGNPVPTPNDGTAGRWLPMETPAIDLQPGEFRIFSVLNRVRVQSGQTYRLDPGWNENGAFILDLKDPTGSTRLVPQGYRAWFGDIVLQDTQTSTIRTKFPTMDLNTVASNWMTIKSGNHVLIRANEFFNGGVTPNFGAFRMPEPVVSGSNGGLNTTKTTYLIEDIANDRVTPHIATWRFMARTTNQMENPDLNQALRGWIDTNPRFLSSNSLWDGSRIDGSNQRQGWHCASPFLGVWNAPGRPRVVGDGRGGNRGLLAEGGSAISEPEVNRSGGRYQGFGGPADSQALGKNHVILYDVPRAPLVSIGQFQHAQLARYQFEPGFVLGNSYANPRIPLNATVARNFAGTSGMTIADISYEINERLWDSFFFSTLGADYVGDSSQSLDTAFDFVKLASGSQPLPNPRMMFEPQPNDTSLNNIITQAGDRAPEAMAARIMIRGAFNVNSTSKTAWKAILSSMVSSDLPTINPQTQAVSWNNNAGIRFQRFSHPVSNVPYLTGQAGSSNGFWQGWRQISDGELDRLAEEMVNEVRARGPFRSMSEFVNRNPRSTQVDHQRKGALQAALDRSINASFPSTVGKATTTPAGSQFSNAMSNETTATGHAGHVLQGDVLQALAPILQVRSDTFKIRTCGETLDANGRVIARAWCEAVVQRRADYLDPRDPCYLTPSELTQETNRLMGRRYQIVSFRWLTAAEI